MRSIFTGASSTPGTSISALWQMGVKIDEKGVMSVDATKLESALQNNFSDVVTAFTGNHNGLSAYSTQNAGFAGDGVRKLSKLLGPNGPMLSQSTNAETQNTKYKDDLTQLDTRMTALLARYTKQFAAMDSLVGNVNSQKTSLKATFDGMMATYTNK
jgi:flagellar hook-associated protein 2